MKLDLGRINFANGNFKEAVESGSLSDTLKGFVIGSVGSTEDAIFNLKKFDQIGCNAILEIKILLAAHLVCLGAHKEAIAVINSLGKITDSSFSGDLKEYFVSTISFLMKVLSKENFDLEYVQGKTSIIGDSHVLGFSGSCKTRRNLSFYYLPGVTFRSLATPFNNIKKQGLSNAVSLSQSTENLVLSIGEIEMRAAFENLEVTEFTLETLLSHFSQFTKFFNLLRVSHQNTILIEPPLPKSIPPVKISEAKHFYQKFTHNLLTICNDEGIEVVRYGAPIGGFELLAERSDVFVDHAHYQNEHYFKLLSRLLKNRR